MSEESHIAATKSAMSKAYVPYSNYPVGVLIITDKGNTYSGCNVENASYPLGNCAEASAIASMVMGGERKIKTIYVDKGATLKRIRARAKGRAAKIQKQTSHITLTVGS